VAVENHAAAFVAFSADVEEQVRLTRVRGLRKWRLEPQHPACTPSRIPPEPQPQREKNLECFEWSG
jgi:hypothetical protein